MARGKSEKSVGPMVGTHQLEIESEEREREGGSICCTSWLWHIRNGTPTLPARREGERDDRHGTPNTNIAQITALLTLWTRLDWWDGANGRISCVRFAKECD